MVHYTDEDTTTVQYYQHGHGVYTTSTVWFDLVMGYFTHATANDVQWFLTARSEYELDYSDIPTKFGLLVAWADINGLDPRTDMSDWWIKDVENDHRVPIPPNRIVSGVRRVQEHEAEIRTHGGMHRDSPYNGLKQDKDGNLFVTCCNETPMRFSYDITWTDGSVTNAADWCRTFHDRDETDEQKYMIAHCDDCGHMYFTYAKNVNRSWMGYQHSKTRNAILRAREANQDK
jgi:hypothetical protein